jgi:hypothetical protein
MCNISYIIYYNEYVQFKMRQCIGIIQHSRIGITLYVSTALSLVSSYIPRAYSHTTSRTTDTNIGTADSDILALVSVSTILVCSVDRFNRGRAVLAVYILRCCVTYFQRYTCLRDSHTTYYMSHQQFSKQHFSSYTHVRGKTFVDNTYIQIS